MNESRTDWQELVSTNGIFQTLIEEYGASPTKGAATENAKEDMEAKKTSTDEAAAATNQVHKGGGNITEEEERIVGAVSWHTYHDWLSSMGSWWRPALPLLLLAAAQLCHVSDVLFLGFWSGHTIEGFSQSSYMAVYGGKMDSLHPKCD